MFSCFLVKSRGNKVIYLGQNVPHEDLVSIYKDHNPDYLLTVMTTYPLISDVQAYLYKVSESFANAKILVSGNQVVGQDMDIPENVILLNKLQDLIDYLYVDEES